MEDMVASNVCNGLCYNVWHQNIQCSTLHIPYTNSGNQMRLYTTTEQIKIKKLFQMFSMIWFGLIDNIK